MAKSNEWGMGHLDVMPESVGVAQRDLIVISEICAKAGLGNASRRLLAIAQWLETFELHGPATPPVKEP